MLYGYEFRWKGEMPRATRREFSATYPNSELATIVPENFEESLG